MKTIVSDPATRPGMLGDNPLIESRWRYPAYDIPRLRSHDFAIYLGIMNQISEAEDMQRALAAYKIIDEILSPSLVLRRASSIKSILKDNAAVTKSFKLPDAVSLTNHAFSQHRTHTALSCLDIW